MQKWFSHFTFYGRETRVRADASIQAKEVRDAVCDILEGGQRAFEQRYRRINLGN